MEVMVKVKDILPKVESFMAKWKKLLEEYNTRVEEANKEVKEKNKQIARQNELNVKEVEAFLKPYSDDQLRSIFLETENIEKRVASLFWDNWVSYRYVRLKEEVEIPLPKTLTFLRSSYGSLRKVTYTQQIINVYDNVNTYEESFHIGARLTDALYYFKKKEIYEHKYLLELKNKLRLLEEYNVETVTLSDDELKLLQELETLENLGEIL